MRWFEPLRLEREEGDVLVIHKDRPSIAEDRGNCLLILILTCAAAMIPFGAGWDWDPSPSATFRWNRAIVGGEVLVLAVASVAVWVIYRRSALGRWRIGGDRVEFFSRDGDRRSLARDEVDRVGMFGPTIRLVGRQAPDQPRRRGHPRSGSATSPRSGRGDPVPPVRPDRASRRRPGVQTFPSPGGCPADRPDHAGDVLGDDPGRQTTEPDRLRSLDNRLRGVPARHDDPDRARLEPADLADPSTDLDLGKCAGLENSVIVRLAKRKLFP